MLCSGKTKRDLESEIEFLTHEIEHVKKERDGLRVKIEVLNDKLLLATLLRRHHQSVTTPGIKDYE